MPLKKNHVVLFLSAWSILNLLQAGSTSLFDDEAYYWICSRFPAWGYFDHPPMIAFIIKAGYFLVHIEFGVRLFIVTSSTLTLGIIYILFPGKNDTVFYTTACSVAILHIHSASILAIKT